MTTTTRFAAAFAAALAMALTHPAGAQAAGFTFKGQDCVESVVALAVPAADVQKYVPAGYDVANPATLGVGVLRCDGATVDGGRVRRILVSDVGVGIGKPERCTYSCDGQHFYQLWQVTDSHLLHRETRALGIAGTVVPDMSLVEADVAALGEPAGLDRVKASVPWSVAPYDVLTLTAPGVSVSDKVAGTPNWWHGSGDRTVRVRYSFPSGAAVGAGAGEVRAAEGKLAEILGLSPRYGAGLFITAGDIRGEGASEQPKASASG